MEKSILGYFGDSPAPIPQLAGRLYFGRAMQNPPEPYGTFFVVGQDTLPSHSGRNVVWIKTIQFSLFSRRQDIVADLADTLYVTLEGFAGAMGEATVGSCWMQDRREFFEGDTKLHSQVLTFQFRYTK